MVLPLARIGMTPPQGKTPPWELQGRSRQESLPARKEQLFRGQKLMHVVLWGSQPHTQLFRLFQRVCFASRYPVMAREERATEVLGPGRMDTCCPPGWRHPWSQGRRDWVRELQRCSRGLWTYRNRLDMEQRSRADTWFQGVTAAKIRGSGKGWQSCRAGGKRIKQRLAGSARGGLAQPNTDLLSLL